MEISSISTAMAVERAAEHSILVARKVLQAQQLEGVAAVSLITNSANSKDGESGTLINVYA